MIRGEIFLSHLRSIEAYQAPFDRTRQVLQVVLVSSDLRYLLLLLGHLGPYSGYCLLLFLWLYLN